MCFTVFFTGDSVSAEVTSEYEVLDGNFVRRVFDQMPQKVKTGMLFDVYGALLNEHRRTVLSFWIDEDYSLSEIAEELNITRQGVHDTIKKCENWLFDTEMRLGVVSRMMIQNELIKRYQKNERADDKTVDSLLEQIMHVWEENPWPLRD